MEKSPTLRIANSQYHVGHLIAPAVARERGYFVAEGLIDYQIVPGGLVPNVVEKEAIALSMDERAIDIAIGVRTPSVVYQNSRGVDLYIIGGWRFTPQFRILARPQIKRVKDLQGKKIGLREFGGLDHGLLKTMLIKGGLDPARDVTWISDPIFAYRNTRDHADAMRSGMVDCCSSSPPFCTELEREGFNVLLDPIAAYPGGRPERIVAARGNVLQEHPGLVKAFLKGILRAFWFMRDQPANFAYMENLEMRLRRETANKHEQEFKMFRTPQDLAMMPLPLDGGVPKAGLETMVDEMVLSGELREKIPVEQFLRDQLVREGFQELVQDERNKADWQRATKWAETYGY
jgi:ABC-type nitrate/sulfonate/bicarbonate transport system substrate-binding protein